MITTRHQAIAANVNNFLAGYPNRRLYSLPKILTWHQQAFLFLRLKGDMKEKHWDIVENIKAHISLTFMDVLEKIFQVRE